MQNILLQITGVTNLALPSTASEAFQEGAKAYLGVCQTSIMQLFLRKKLLLTVNYFHKKLQQRYLAGFELPFRAVFCRTSNICRSLICFRDYLY